MSNLIDWYLVELRLRLERKMPGDRIETIVRTGHAASPRGVALGLCQGSPLRSEIEALDPTGLETATDAAAAMVAERCGEGAFETPLQALVVETTR